MSQHPVVCGGNQISGHIIGGAVTGVGGGRHGDHHIPQFDLMLLGLGSDGHIASIFPDRPDLFTTGQLFEVAARPDKKQKRITATGRLINNSSKIYYIVTGKEKAPVVSQVLEGRSGSELYPAARIKPGSGHLVWMLDTGAASLLKG